MNKLDYFKHKNYKDIAVRFTTITYVKEKDAYNCRVYYYNTHFYEQNDYLTKPMDMGITERIWIKSSETFHWRPYDIN